MRLEDLYHLAREAFTSPKYSDGHALAVVSIYLREQKIEYDLKFWHDGGQTHLSLSSPGLPSFSVNWTEEFKQYSGPQYKLSPCQLFTMCVHMSCIVGPENQFDKYRHFKELILLQQTPQVSQDHSIRRL